MKTSNVLASLLFGSIAAAAPLQKRAYATVTHTMVETVLIYTTVWEGEEPSVAAATSTPALFYEQPHKKPSSVAASSTPAYTPPAYTPPVNTPKPEPTSVYTPPPPPPASSSEAAPSSVYTPPPAPESSSVYTPPSPPASSAAPSPPAPKPSEYSGGSGSGETYTGGSLTMNYYQGGLGACGEPVSDDSMTVALGVDLFGDSTYDTMTGLPTNKWCNQKVEITYNGKTALATIMDRCPGCTGPGFDCTPKLWEALTGGVGGASGDRLSGMTWKTVS